MEDGHEGGVCSLHGAAYGDAAAWVDVDVDEGFDEVCGGVFECWQAVEHGVACGASVLECLYFGGCAYGVGR